MITREMIQNGFKKGHMSIEDAFERCISLCCRIGDKAFYFAGMVNSDLTAKEYLEAYTMEEVVDKLFNILKDVESAGKNGLDCMELEYYESILDGTKN